MRWAARWGPLAGAGLLGWGCGDGAQHETTNVGPVSSSTADAGEGGSAADAISGDSGAPPSCSGGGPGLTHCGQDSESCCATLEVEGGTFSRTYANAGTGATGLADPATISSFRLDKYDVTVGRFRQFVAAWKGGWTPPAGSGKHVHLNGGMGLADVSGALEAGAVYETGWVAGDDSNLAPTDVDLSDATCDPLQSFATWTPSAAAQENLPINCMNWYEAYAFCIWDGGFLPSEAEWEYAAAGGGQQREYPWGSTDPGTSNQYAIYGCNYAAGSGTCTNVSNIAPVGSAPLGAGLWGQLDLAGNMRQWNVDWYGLYVDPCTDCAYLEISASRVFRGGSFDGFVAGLLPPTRYDLPLYRDIHVGVRCARTP